MKKGFTLIELLAVIVILAIIALIATPIVLSIIEETKESAVLRSAEYYLSSVENSIMKKNLSVGGSFSPNICEVQSDGNLLCDGTDTLEVEVNGEKPSSGTITFDKGKITNVELTQANKTIAKNEDGKLVLGKVSTSICKLINDIDPKGISIGDKYECDFGGGVRNFYILELGSSPVSNSILKSDEVALILEGNYDTTTQPWCDQAGSNPSDAGVCHSDGLTSKLDEIAGIWTKLQRKQIGIPSVKQLLVADGKSEDEYKTLTNTWLYNWPDNADYGNSAPYGYWTSSTMSGNYYSAWGVTSSGSVNLASVSAISTCGVRPVVNLKL